MLDRVRAARRRRADGRIRGTHADALADVGSVDGRHPRELATVLAALVVHALTLVLFAGGIGVWFTHVTALVKVLVSALLLAVAVVVSPVRLRRAAGLRRSDAPVLFAALAAVSPALGVRTPRRVLVTSELEATSAGRTLRLGLPLWAALTPAGRRAALAWGVAAAARDDVRQHPLVRSANASLDDWLYLLQPDAAGGRRRARRRVGGFAGTSSTVGAADLLLPLVLAPLYGLILGLRAVIRTAGDPAGQRAGYRRLLRVATVAGTPATAELLRALLMRGRIREEMDVGLRRGGTDVVDVGRDYLSALDEQVVLAVRARALDGPLEPHDGGPPPALLLDVLTRLPAGGASPVPDDATLEKVDVELRRWHDEAARDLRDRLEGARGLAEHAR